jgi:hypothetical protein
LPPMHNLFFSPIWIMDNVAMYIKLFSLLQSISLGKIPKLDLMGVIVLWKVWQCKTSCIVWSNCFLSELDARAHNCNPNYMEGVDRIMVWG